MAGVAGWSDGNSWIVVAGEFDPPGWVVPTVVVGLPSLPAFRIDSPDAHAVSDKPTATVMARWLVRTFIIP